MKTFRCSNVMCGRFYDEPDTTKFVSTCRCGYSAYTVGQQEEIENEQI